LEQQAQDNREEVRTLCNRGAGTLDQQDNLIKLELQILAEQAEQAEQEQPDLLDNQVHLDK
jgi:hypothetical protein